MPFSLTDDPQFHGLEMSLSNVLMIGLFPSNNRVAIFSKTEKKNSYHSNHVRNHTSTWRMVLKFVTCLQILLFLNKTSIVNFWEWSGVGGHKIGHFCGCHKCMTPEWFKITTKLIIRGSSFFLNIKPQVRYILTA